MNYKWPDHVKFPEDAWLNFHENHIPVWDTILHTLKNKDSNIGIEVGSFCGGSAVWLLENVIKPSGHLYCIDIEEHELLKHNLSVYKNVTFKKGNSFDVLRSLNNNNTEFADVIYIDGSHHAKNVLEDMVISWNLLKQDGIMILDDYGWGSDRVDYETPKPAIDAFMYIYRDLYEVLQFGWQVFLKKKKYKLTDDFLERKYETYN